MDLTGPTHVAIHGPRGPLRREKGKVEAESCYNICEIAPEVPIPIQSKAPPRLKPLLPNNNVIVHISWSRASLPVIAHDDGMQKRIASKLYVPISHYYNWGKEKNGTVNYWACINQMLALILPFRCRNQKKRLDEKLPSSS